ncbi:NAD(P)/FAD-dependent oxidoreductase [Saccharopolyspora erythraea]|uniref:NAD(P)/FAD-dependent oxidoreductase n=1 Tax=Saccharopolyspora erythraea TaxID=1836 RepID=UPI001BA57790|nr:NAD(P)/FAD-dependent oxidoreductase [Saccharopolyspora erythraea]QUG99645.1 NAD(P)/FAD-dependent oxidoreductase [Saccharopolyspora erythraea]
MDATRYDAVVLGGGAAGLSAATLLARSRRRVVVVDAGEPRNAPSAHLHNFLSRDGMAPAELLAAGRRELAGYGGEVVEGLAVAVKHAERGFAVRLASGADLSTRGVLVATGLRDELAEIPGLRDRWGDTVLHCPYCHGHEVRDQPIGVVGGDNRPFTLHQAALVRLWSDDVTFFPNRIALEAGERERLTAWGVRVIDGDVARLSARDGLTVELADGREVGRKAVFVGPRFVPNDRMLTELGCEVGDDGWVTTDASGRTSVAGVWAAGNVVDSPAQLVSAAGAGSTAAIALNHHLLAQDVERAGALTRA